MISVIVPTLNEAAIIGSSLADILSHPGDFEVIVADGGSIDATLALVSRFPPVKHTVSPKGRGRQMNAGANLARGDVLLFIHADTRLPVLAFQQIREALRDRSVVGGSFTMHFDRPSLLLRFYARFTRINRTLFTYGDQGLFIGSHTFRAMGGFRELPIMEDVEIQKRLRRMGKFVKISNPVVTSARRYVKHGNARQQLRNTALVLSYHLGLSPEYLSRFYESLRSSL